MAGMITDSVIGFIIIAAFVMKTFFATPNERKRPIQGDIA